MASSTFLWGEQAQGHRLAESEHTEIPRTLMINVKILFVFQLARSPSISCRAYLCPSVPATISYIRVPTYYTFVFVFNKIYKLSSYSLKPTCSVITLIVCTLISISSSMMAAISVNRQLFVVCGRSSQDWNGMLRYRSCEVKNMEQVHWWTNLHSPWKQAIMV